MSTQIILTATLDKVGAEGDTLVVSDGYARNYLIPKGLAIPATDQNLRRIQRLREKREQEQTAQLAEAKRAARKLTKHSCTITVAAGTDGKLFGSVTATDIFDALKAGGLDLERRKIMMEDPIRELGVYEVEVKLHPEVTGKVKVWVVSNEQGTPERSQSSVEQETDRTSKSKAGKKK